MVGSTLLKKENKMKIGIVGLGDIAKKAYLPILCAREEIELIPCTRNPSTLREVMDKYHLAKGYLDVDDLLREGIDAVFITAATDAHEALVETFLKAGVPVHIDKPLTMHYETSESLVMLSEERKVPMMVGFNRRFVPLVKKVHDLGVPERVLYQKNRYLKPDAIRRFIVEDFVHVIDTTRYLLQSEVSEVAVFPKLREGKLVSITIVLGTPVNHGICIMDYENGVTEEIVEVFHTHRKSILRNLASIESYEHGVHTIDAQKDWESTLHKRGFEDLIDAFLGAIKNREPLPIPLRDSLKTHEICEQIVIAIENKRP
ncbi:MAG TPA: gfo/Idh/MocA family oxidoreductase [Erysipelotrichaceae bacterium]|nr:gfo/Idh/MocA family oxidoreductase [Erysipelotrichaceae bacterium]HAO61837.1 gfo/Idh/MocA family oxidoreductase [Erysipelotrichaceae bacterium]HBZ42390.1 gfo/Idh/MocA family oxidoreductase [Erysipelotrichaceae bacterium]